MPRRRKVELLGAVLLALVAPTYSACGAGRGARGGSSDMDRDGVSGAADRCPVVPEDVDGFEDEDGCPDRDEDGDGDTIVDRDDRCPTEPETFQGYEDEDGCPDRPICTVEVDAPDAGTTD